MLHFTQCSACASSGTLNTLCSTLRCSRCAEPQNQLHQLCMLGCWQLMMAWLAEPATTTARGVSNISKSAAATPHQSSAKFRCANRHLLPTLLRCAGWSPATLAAATSAMCAARLQTRMRWRCQRHQLGLQAPSRKEEVKCTFMLSSPAAHAHTYTHSFRPASADTPLVIDCCPH